MSPDCIFCKIIADQVPSQKVHHDERVTAFRDIHPVAPTHILIVLNKHIVSVNDLTAEDAPLAGHMFTVAHKLAEQEGISQSGYQLVINTGPDAGQAVPHLHLHLIGGQRRRHPMG